MVDRCDFYSDEEYEYAKQMEYEEFQESLAMEEEKERLAYEEYLKKARITGKEGRMSMKLSKPKYIPWSRSYSKTGRKKGYLVEISYNDYYNEYYFLLYKGEYAFNSLWKNLKYTTEEECVIGAEKYIEALAKMGE